MDKMKLGQLHIGEADATDEVNSEIDFSQLFYTKNNKYQELLKPITFAIAGRKGTGKSLLALYYQKENHSKKNRHIVYYKKFKRIQDDEAEEFSNNIENLDIRIHYQRYFLLTSILGALIKESSVLTYSEFKYKSDGLFKYADYLGYKKVIKKINDYSFFKDSKNERKGVYSSHSETTRKTSNIKAKGTNLRGSLEVGSNQESGRNYQYTKSRYASNLKYLESLMEEVLQYVSIELFLDDLDEVLGFNKEQLPEYLSNLLENIKDLNDYIKTIDKKSRIVAVIREDLLKETDAMVPNLGKKLTGGQVSINWTNGHNKEELEALIFYKIQQSVRMETGVKYTKEELAEKFFVLSKNKVKNAPLERMMENSMGRPRDLVTFINIICSNYPEHTQISKKLVNQCLMEYSANLERDLKNELGTHYPKEFVDDAFDILRLIGQIKFTFEEFLDIAKRNYIYSEDELKNMLLILFEFSVIGNTVEKKWVANGQKVTFQYYYSGKIKPNFDHEFKTHWGLSKALNI